jgi:hypothetical protein
MASNDSNSTLKRLRNRYRLVVMNDDTYEEVVTFKLSRTSVYVGFSVIFVLMIGLTTMLLVLTPLKFYIPGYGTRNSQRQLQLLKIRTDSLEQAMVHKDQYLKSLQQVLAGEVNIKQDTTLLKVPEHPLSDD